MFEAELKAELDSDKAKELNERLRNSGGGGTALIYCDLYFDLPGGQLAAAEKELRLRRIIGAGSETCHLTFKDSPFDSGSKSKRELETSVGSFDQAAKIVEAMGYVRDLQYEKHCSRYAVTYAGLGVEVVIVELPELARWFIECEVASVSTTEATNAIEVLGGLVQSLGVPANAVTSEYYTDMIRRHRSEIGK
jgi:predicted adenylyl cyclase CyaB